MIHDPRAWVDNDPADPNAKEGPPLRCKLYRKRRLRHPFLLLLIMAVLVPAPHAGAAPNPDTSYVALGDSFAAGPLVAPADPVAPGCARSLSNYPHLLAARYRLTNYTDVSCSAAFTDHLFTPQPVPSGPHPPQLDAVDAGTQLVTVQIGGNDMGFAEIVGGCLSLLPLGTPCRDRYASGGSDHFAHRIAAVRPKVDGVLAAIRAKAPSATIFLIGYPSLLPENSYGCWPWMPYAAEDLPYLIGIERQLSTMLAESAAANGVHYVDLYTPSLGRDPCATPAVRWVEPVLLPIGAAPIHPNLAGMIGMEAVIAAAVEANTP